MHMDLLYKSSFHCLLMRYGGVVVSLLRPQKDEQVISVFFVFSETPSTVVVKNLIKVEKELFFLLSTSFLTFNLFFPPSVFQHACV